LLKTLDDQTDMCFIFTKANADTDGRIINNMIEDYVSKNSHKAIAFTSLGQLRYLSAIKYMDGVIGNSSSGLIEAPSFQIGTINIGDRQKGRIKAESIIDCLPNKKSIQRAMKKLFSEEFQEKLKTVSNPYGEGETSEKIFSVIRSVSLDGLVRKHFYDRSDSCE
jgi:GDP/UDP-N,N'-diacetylbacillosamine 2-epimerase (hydrolysing)